MKLYYMTHIKEAIHTYILHIYAYNIFFYTVTLAQGANASVCWCRGNFWGGGESAGSRHVPRNIISIK